jgi:hypothetical protein
MGRDCNTGRGAETEAFLMVWHCHWQGADQ